MPRYCVLACDHITGMGGRSRRLWYLRVLRVVFGLVVFGVSHSVMISGRVELCSQAGHLSRKEMLFACGSTRWRSGKRLVCLPLRK